MNTKPIYLDSIYFDDGSLEDVIAQLQRLHVEHAQFVPLELRGDLHGDAGLVELWGRRPETEAERNVRSRAAASMAARSKKAKEAKRDKELKELARLKEKYEH